MARMRRTSASVAGDGDQPSGSCMTSRSSGWASSSLAPVATPSARPRRYYEPCMSDTVEGPAHKKVRMSMSRTPMR